MQPVYGSLVAMETDDMDWKSVVGSSETSEMNRAESIEIITILDEVLYGPGPSLPEVGEIKEEGPSFNSYSSLPTFSNRD